MPLLFAVTLFVSAFLLFNVELMIAQMILPLLGGTPAVWNTCMVFFQAAMLAGYGYTHTATTYMPVKRQTLAQIALLLLPFAFFVMPFGLGNWTPATEANPIWTVLFVLLTTVGLPFFVVATSAPLLQRWFSTTGHASAKDPYFLYGASNLGSMLALISYPFVFQPFFELPNMALFWMFSYMALIALVVLCALAVWYAVPAMAVQLAGAGTPSVPLTPGKAEQHVSRRPIRQRSKAALAASVAPAVIMQKPSQITWPRRLRWIGLAAAPSSLMLGFTTYVTTDIAAVPLFWIVPLALYLLSFILVFAKWPVVWTEWPHRLCVYIQPLVMLLLGVMIIPMMDWYIPDHWVVAAHLLAMFVCVMVCHGELSKDRPDAQHLTEFYLWMAVGGVVGGLFNGLLAPLIFKQAIEYFVVLLVVLFLRPQTHFWSWLRRRPEPADDHSIQEYLLDIGYAACLGLLAYALLKFSMNKTFLQSQQDLTGYLRESYKNAFGMTWQSAWQWARWTEMLMTEGVPVAICLCFAGRPVRLGLAVIGLFVVNYYMLIDRDIGIIYQNRSYFSVQTVRRDTIKDMGTYNILMHGRIDHGRQNLNPGPTAQAAMASSGIPYFRPDNKRDQPISYFFPTNPIGQIFMQLRNLPHKPPFAVVGLGTGTLATYAEAGQEVDIYEIDAAVLHLSEPPEGGETYFYYLQDARKRGVKLKVTLGDGRLKIMDAEPKKYQVIVLDAFSSDAIPVHLMTREAVQLYLSKLKDDGILIFNITNRYVSLAPVLADVAREFDLVCLEQGDGSDDRLPEKFGTDWVIMFPKPKNVDKMACKAAALMGALQPGAALANPLTGLGAIPGLDYQVPFPQRLDMWRWNRQKASGRPVWTDHYQNVLPAMNWFSKWFGDSDRDY